MLNSFQSFLHRDGIQSCEHDDADIGWGGAFKYFIVKKLFRDACAVMIADGVNEAFGLAWAESVADLT